MTSNNKCKADYKFEWYAWKDDSTTLEITKNGEHIWGVILR